MTVANMKALLEVATAINAFAEISNLEFPDSDYFYLPLECILYINHLIQIKKDQTKIWTPLDSGNEVNIMTLDYVASLDLKIWPIEVRV